jgi:hypothetical protein
VKEWSKVKSGVDGRLEVVEG